MGNSSEKPWTHKWEKRAGDHAYVEVSRVTTSAHEEDGTGPYRWAVYAHISETHPLYQKFDLNGSIWQAAVKDIPLHWGNTFFATHTFRRPPLGMRSWVQVGADYNHLHDQLFTHMGTPEEAREVFVDADTLREFLIAYPADVEGAP